VIQHAVHRRILLLEDDPNLGFVLQEHLESRGFQVTRKQNGEEGLTAVRQRRFDLCLVDVMMPKKDGFTFMREFRARDSNTPVIFLTAKSLKEDRIEGFKLGGDDYITKPFSIEELLLRIQAVLKRTSKADSDPVAPGPIKIGKFNFDAQKQILRSGGTQKALTTKEAEILSLLCTHRDNVVLRDDILARVWGNDSYFNGRSLDVFISKLRKHLISDRTLEIRNVHGKGYKLTTR
jgi:DNA-binding response OmpR family regulator